MTYDEWLKTGIDNDWCGPVICHTHDGTPTTKEEDEYWDTGDDVCLWIVRVYESTEQARAVEANHSPSVWRKN